VQRIQGVHPLRVGSAKDSSETIQTPSTGSSANHISINLGGATLATMIVLTIVIGTCGVVMGLNLSDQAALQREFQRETERQIQAMGELQRQYRMTELKLDDWTVVAHRSGLVLPGDYTRGPQGNPDADAFKQPKRK
jgi:hypothetical protein